MRQATAAVVLTAVLLCAAACPAIAADLSLDQYGGIKVPVAKPTGSFSRAKVGNRWVLVTPEGHPFWMLGVFLVNTTGSIDDLKDSYLKRVIRKYGSTTKWAEQTVKRLRAWHFNTIAEYASLYALPVRSPYGGKPNAEKMPFVALVRPSYYGLTNNRNYARGPFKDVIAGTDPAVYTGWRGNGAPDVFDPNFEQYADGWAKAIDREMLTSPWLIGIAIDDADNIVGFGPGPEISAPRIHPHIAWLVLAGSFQQAANKRLNVTYTDPKVYSKYALRDFLRAKYGNLQALNTAWESTYTTWDSDGGWPSGKGFLDENGRGSWIGNDFNRLTTAKSSVRGDLDDFLYEYARRYFTVLTAPFRKHAPGKLLFGPATLNGWGGLTRRQILRAAGESLDVVQAGVSRQEALELTLKYTGDVPLVTWEGTVANSDSALWRYPNAEASLHSQEERARKYTERTKLLLNATTPSGAKPVVGLKLWALTDSWGEKKNWGLVSFLDNAYDGKEAVIAAGVDRWGFPTGGEEKNYGDFVSSVRDANQAVLLHLFRELEQAGVRAQ